MLLEQCRHSRCGLVVGRPGPADDVLAVCQDRPQWWLEVVIPQRLSDQPSTHGSSNHLPPDELVQRLPSMTGTGVCLRHDGGPELLCEQCLCRGRSQCVATWHATPAQYDMRTVTKPVIAAEHADQRSAVRFAGDAGRRGDDLEFAVDRWPAKPR